MAIKESNQRIAITLPNDLTGWLISAEINQGFENHSQLIKWLLLNYLQFKYEPIEIEEEEIKELLAKYGRKYIEKK